MKKKEPYHFVGCHFILVFFRCFAPKKYQNKTPPTSYRYSQLQTREAKSNNKTNIYLPCDIAQFIHN